jgi:23S rRNA (cytosine1962-C5)-methyltransferase
MNIVTVKKAREGVLRRKHPWVFSGALEALSSRILPGDICQVLDARGSVLGFAFVNPKSDIACRMLSFGKSFDPSTFIEDRLLSAWHEREILVSKEISTAFRVCNAEGDGLPGLIVDIYDDAAVLQISTMGMERCKERVVATLKSLGICRIYEKSKGSSRVREGLSAEAAGCLFAPAEESDPQAIISEHGLCYTVPLLSGQKTGFFLDQREMRLLVQRLSSGKSLLNCFAYSGGFSFNALRAGAKAVVSVDSSASACASMAANAALNQLQDDPRHQIVCDDVLKFLRASREKFDVIILDPPPYVKKAKDQKRGFKHYQELNQLGLERLAPGGILLSFSCSPFFSEEEWQQMLSAAMMAAGCNLRLLALHRHALDHPVALSHPEGRYLKGSVLQKAHYE